MTLIVTDGTQPSDDGQGYLLTPGIYTEGQIAGWRRVTSAVHAAGGRIVIQLMHVGRMRIELVFSCLQQGSRRTGNMFALKKFSPFTVQTTSWSPAAPLGESGARGKLFFGWPTVRV
jgi:2,4-dienoyl-CoA reductase-like NADH-dependent reductase (Old Yellow Enzyme family)